MAQKETAGKTAGFCVFICLNLPKRLKRGGCWEAPALGIAACGEALEQAGESWAKLLADEGVEAVIKEVPGGVFFDGRFGFDMECCFIEHVGFEHQKRHFWS